MELHDDEPNDVKKAISVEEEIKRGNKEDTFEGYPRSRRKKDRGTSEKQKQSKLPDEGDNCCEAKKKTAAASKKYTTMNVFPKPCKLPKREIIPRHCLNREQYLNMLSTPNFKCPSQCKKITVTKKLRPVSERIKELALPSRRRLIHMLRCDAKKLPPELVDNLIKTVEGESCMTPEQAARVMRDKKRPSKRKDSKFSSSNMRVVPKNVGKKRRKSGLNSTMTTMDKDAVNAQYMMAECFVRSIFEWNCPIPREEFKDIAEVICHRLCNILEHSPLLDEDKTGQQVKLLADLISCWIAGVLFEVADKQKEDLKSKELEECQGVSNNDDGDDDDDDECDDDDVYGYRTFKGDDRGGGRDSDDDDSDRKYGRNDENNDNSDNDKRLIDLQTKQQTEFTESNDGKTFKSTMVITVGEPTASGENKDALKTGPADHSQKSLDEVVQTELSTGVSTSIIVVGSTNISSVATASSQTANPGTSVTDERQQSKDNESQTMEKTFNSQFTTPEGNGEKTVVQTSQSFFSGKGEELKIAQTTSLTIKQDNEEREGVNDHAVISKQEDLDQLQKGASDKDSTSKDLLKVVSSSSTNLVSSKRSVTYSEKSAKEATNYEQAIYREPVSSTTNLKKCLSAKNSGICTKICSQDFGIQPERSKTSNKYQTTKKTDFSKDSLICLENTETPLAHSSRSRILNTETTACVPCDVTDKKRTYSERQSSPAQRSTQLTCQEQQQSSNIPTARSAGPTLSKSPIRKEIVIPCIPSCCVDHQLPAEISVIIDYNNQLNMCRAMCHEQRAEHHIKSDIKDQNKITDVVAHELGKCNKSRS